MICVLHVVSEAWAILRLILRPTREQEHDKEVAEASSSVTSKYMPIVVGLPNSFHFWAKTETFGYETMNGRLVSLTMWNSVGATRSLRRPWAAFEVWWDARQTAQADEALHILGLRQ